MSHHKCCCDTSGHTIAGCPCTNIPDTIYLHVASQPTPPTRSYAHPTAIVWQTRPSDLASYGVEPVGYFSDVVETYGVVFGATVLVNRYRYRFGCDGSGLYTLQGYMTPDSPLDYPRVFAVATWATGFTGNTCSPFLLTFGSTYNDAFSDFRHQGITIDAVGPP